MEKPRRYYKPSLKPGKRFLLQEYDAPSPDGGKIREGFQGVFKLLTAPKKVKEEGSHIVVKKVFEVFDLEEGVRRTVQVVKALEDSLGIRNYRVV